MNLFFKIGCLFALFGVVLGAFGAHGLESRLSPERLATFETGVRYQFYHAFALLIASLASTQVQQARFLRIAAWLFIIGIFLFSGSIYLLACRDLIGLTTWRWLGPLTPIGGTCFIVGWGLLFLAATKNEK